MLDFTSLKYKIAIIFFIPALGMLYFSSTYVKEKYNSLQNVKILTETIDFGKYTSQLIHELQKERGLSSGFLGKGDFNFVGSLKKQRILTDNAYNIFLDHLSLNTISKTEKLSLKIKTSLSFLQELPSYREKIDTKDISFYKEVKFYSSTIDSLISSIPQLNRTFSSMEISNNLEALFSLLYMKEYAGIERAFLTNIFSYDAITAEQFKDIQKLIIQQNIYYNKFIDYSSIKNFYNYQKKISTSIIEKLKIYRETILLSKKAFKTDAMSWYSFSTNRINKLDLIAKGLMQEILDNGNNIKVDSNIALFISALLWLFSLIALFTLSLILSKLIHREEKNIRDLHKQHKHYTTLANMSENIIYLDNENDLYSSLCRILVQISKFKVAWIGIVDDKKQSIIPHVANNISIERLAQVNFSTSPNQDSTLKAPEKAFLARSYIILGRDELNLSLECKEILGISITSVGAFPIYKDNKIIAILTLFSENENVFNIELIDLIEKMLRGLSFAINKIEGQRLQLLTKEDLRISSYAFESHEAMAVTDINANIIKINKAFTDITGYSEQDVIGKNPRVLQSSKHDKYFYQQMWEDLKTLGKWKGEIYNKRKNGEIYPEMLSITAIKDENDTITNYIAQFVDISYIKNAQEEAEYKAQHDALTGISNRVKLLKDTEYAFNIGRHTKIQHAFMFLDIDDFKRINDFHGHNIGDLILIEIASRLNMSVRESDILARLGGDEFAIIAMELDTDEHVAAKKATILAEKIKLVMKEPIIINSQSFDITFSIGIKIFPDNEKTPQEVIGHADIAMYQAKKLGRNQFSFYDQELDIESKQFIIMEKDLNHAIKENEFELHYQPKVDILTNNILGVEALIRWNHPTKGTIYPDDFLNIANDTRLIHKIGNFVIDEACKQISLWQNEFKDFNYSISINISANQFQKDEFTTYIRSCIYKYDIDASLLELELLEDTLIGDTEKAIKKIHILKALGIKFSIDDFGTGYSSMTYLQRLPVDSIKIDKSFIMDLNSKSNQEIVKMIINFTKIFNLNVVAEGVENEHALDFLKRNNCDMYQGYYFSRPLNLNDITKLLKMQ